MQLRSGRTTLSIDTPVYTLKRDSRNYEEFIARRRYHQEQKRIEEYINDDEFTTNEYLDKKTILINKWKTITRRTKHLLYLNDCQKQQKCSFTERLKTIRELYKFFLYNIDDLIEVFNSEGFYDKRFPELVYRKGNELRVDIARANNRTRNEKQLAGECNDIINRVTQIIYRNILANQN